MNKLFKAALLVAGAALISQTAQAAYNPDDLVLGFDSPSAANDYIIDLGQASSILGTPTTDLSSLFSLSTFNSTFSGLDGTSMGVVGGNSALTSFNVYVTGSGQPFQLAGNPLKTAVGDVSVMVGNLGLSGGLSTTDPRTDPNSYNNKVAPSVGIGSFLTDSGVNPLAAASGNVLTENLWEQSGNNAFLYKGYFTLDLSGDTTHYLTFTAVPVPEPSVFGLLGGFGALGLWFRSRFNRKTN